MYAVAAALLAELSDPLHGASTCGHPDCARLAHANQSLALGPYIRLGHLQGVKCTRGQCSLPVAQGMLFLEPTQYIPASRQTHEAHETCGMLSLGTTWDTPLSHYADWRLAGHDREDVRPGDLIAVLWQHRTTKVMPFGCRSKTGQGLSCLSVGY